MAGAVYEPLLGESIVRDRRDKYNRKLISIHTISSNHFKIKDKIIQTLSKDNCTA